MEFECKRCGFCCLDAGTQINLSLLDLKWLSTYMKKTVKELFEDGIIGFLPFLQADDLDCFDIELGLKKPCPLHDGKCSVYNARPLNCRTFPYWLINNKIEDDLDCIQGVTAKYNDYEKLVGKILLEEGEKTAKFLKKIGASQKIDLSTNLEFSRLKKKLEGIENKSEIGVVINEMMTLAETKMDYKIFEKIPLIQKEVKRLNFGKEIDSLIKAEELV